MPKEWHFQSGFFRHFRAFSGFFAIFRNFHPLPGVFSGFLRAFCTHISRFSPVIRHPSRARARVRVYACARVCASARVRAWAPAVFRVRSHSGRSLAMFEQVRCRRYDRLLAFSRNPHCTHKWDPLTLVPQTLPAQSVPPWVPFAGPRGSHPHHFRRFIFHISSFEEDPPLFSHAGPFGSPARSTSFHSLSPRVPERSLGPPFGSGPSSLP